MHERMIRDLKRDIRALERAGLLGEKDDVIAIAKKIENAAKSIVKGCQSPLAAAETELQPLIKGVAGASVDMLYKPVTVPNPLNGDYLIRFSDARTMDLKRAGALERHNAYWTKNEVIGGNIYGSLPLSIIDDDARRKLLSAGWDKVSCSVERFDADKSVHKIARQYKSDNALFLLIRECETQQILAINF